MEGEARRLPGRPLYGGRAPAAADARRQRHLFRLTICLDTNPIVVVLNGASPRIRARLDRAVRDGDDVRVPSVVLFELWYGAAKSAQRLANAGRIRQFMAGRIAPLPFDGDDAEEAGAIRGALERAGTPIGPHDVLIAAQARRRGAVLVTANTREFARVPGLALEDRSRPRGGLTPARAPLSP